VPIRIVLSPSSRSESPRVSRRREAAGFQKLIGLLPCLTLCLEGLLNDLRMHSEKLNTTDATLPFALNRHKGVSFRGNAVARDALGVHVASGLSYRRPRYTAWAAFASGLGMDLASMQHTRGQMRSPARVGRSWDCRVVRSRLGCGGLRRSRSGLGRSSPDTPRECSCEEECSTEHHFGPDEFATGRYAQIVPVTFTVVLTVTFADRICPLLSCMLRYAVSTTGAKLLPNAIV
jgi:hypothetical protein